VLARESAVARLEGALENLRAAELTPDVLLDAEDR
jgi:hypothetical protein